MILVAWSFEIGHQVEADRSIETTSHNRMLLEERSAFAAGRS